MGDLSTTSFCTSTIHILSVFNVLLISVSYTHLAIGAVILALVLLSRKKKLFAAGIVVVVIGVIAAGVLANTTRCV